MHGVFPDGQAGGVLVEKRPVLPQVLQRDDPTWGWQRGQVGPFSSIYWTPGGTAETCRLDVLHDAPGQGASVECVGTLLGDSLVRIGQLWEAHNVVFPQDFPLRVAEDGAGGRGEKGC